MKLGMKSKILLAITPFIATIALAGCGTASSSTGAAAGTSSANATGGQSDQGVVVNIGTQALTGPMYLAQKKGWFEQAFAKVGAKVNFVQFTSGPPFFPAIASNHIDFGQVGNAPVLVGQAANVNFEEIAVDSDGKKGDAILVPKGSPITSLQDLKGKKVAVAQGSSAYNLLYQALAHAGLSASDIHIVQLQPNQAQPAFDSHAVDAWATWDPYITEEVSEHGAVELTNEQDLGTASPGFTIVRTKFAQEHPDLVVLFLKVYQQALDWQNQHLDSAVQLYAQSTHLSPQIVKQMILNSDEENAEITNQVIQEQQTTADFLYSHGGLSAKVDVSKVVDNSYIEQALKESEK
ncbi:aliphatic sulfonate ABC transporter substrate-binding protein [Alicyclobacillus fastidiosus]|uniref:Aliphatic sulfonate ABC transporter substrate-binding protein n=1 Tax=Alicyclobacillus fastidiosus TaxID=392011 RepID=A0ABV5AA22_9BACL|nr:aliphatic sulfonate ABC transporter substrate-binding protein [Alicyclobacillus fastidiosus]WEH07740.1 aliphatic sulfonate ABC transporter substrate-binding protein [Alicyclobacillus fastidiosus]